MLAMMPMMTTTPSTTAMMNNNGLDFGPATLSDAGSGVAEAEV